MGVLGFPRAILSIAPVIYVWSLPLLATWGIVNEGESISAMIATPPATGMMAAVMYTPLVLMFEYQDALVPKEPRPLMYTSLWTFQTCYGAFLCCTVGYVPDAVHAAVVIAFALSFCIHAGIICNSVQINTPTRAILATGGASFVSLLFVKHMWFWAMEALGITCMVMFTPVDILLADDAIPLITSGVHVETVL